MPSENAPRPSVLKVLFTDYGSFLLLVLQVGALVTVVGIPALLALTPISVLRVRWVRRIFVTGRAGMATVVGRHFRRALWTVTYEFEDQGQTVRTRDYILSFKLPIQLGDRLAVIYDPEKPSRALLTMSFLPGSDGNA